MIKEEALVGLGLTKNEAKVYLALLKLGKATVVEITKQSHVHRVNAYDVLERLQEKGLIATVFLANKKVYEAANPDQLGTLIKEKQEVLDQVLPSLKEEFKLKKEKQQVYHFLGVEGVMQAYSMILEQNTTLYGIGGSGLNRKYLKHRHEMWNKERIKRGIRGKVIYYEFTRKERGSGWKKDLTMDIRYIPDSYKTIGMIDICGNLVVNLLPLEGSIMAIVIENKTLADTYRQFFEFMWKNAKE